MMFNNLIESSSHRKEYKRRGSFFLLTTGTYAVLLLISGVASIYAYDARLEDQVYQEVVTMLPVPEPAPVTPTTPNTPNRPRPADNDRSAVPERATAMLPVNRPDVVPPDVSAKPNKALPLPNGPVKITGRDWDPPMPSGGGRSSGSGGTRIVPPAAVVLDVEPPPDPPSPPANKIVKSKGVINGLATYLPKPKYPPLALQIRLPATINVQVLIDEKGNVVSAKALGGHPMFVREATNAALQARFSPTMLGDQAVKVSGIITYNFVLP